jgi:hypothetical protein
MYENRRHVGDEHNLCIDYPSNRSMLLLQNLREKMYIHSTLRYSIVNYLRKTMIIMNNFRVRKLCTHRIYDDGVRE